MIAKMIKVLLWWICCVCLYMILTTRDVETFGVVGFVGFIATWVLIRWNKYDDDDFKNISNLMG